MKTLCLSFAIAATALAVGGAQPVAESKETQWSEWLASELLGRPPVNGEDIEVYTHDLRRVDILTPTHAIEVEWCNRSKLVEAIEQAKYYATATGRKPAIVLLVGRGDARRERDLYWACCQIAMREGIGTVLTLDINKLDTRKLRSVLGHGRVRR